MPTMIRSALIPLALTVGLGLAGCGGARDVQYTQARAIDTDVAAVHEERGPTAIDPGESFTRDREPPAIHTWQDSETVD
jgi:hypothetical protein